MSRIRRSSVTSLRVTIADSERSGSPSKRRRSLLSPSTVWV